MRGLFWRVFLWYLGTTMLLLGLGVGILMLTNQGSWSRGVTVSPDLVRSQAIAAAQAWEQGGQPALRVQFEKAQRARFLFDDSGRELSGRPQFVSLKALVARAASSASMELELSGADTFAALGITERGKHFVFVRVLPRTQAFQDRVLPIWARAALGIFTAGFMCLLFAHYVTSPLRSLRSATREFAGGNLQVRIGNAKPFNRRDEFADVARDFDNMATQIQNLVLSQQRMLGDISHELRSPLTRLQVALEIARRKSGPEAEPPLNRIEQEAERLNTLIGQILRAARVDLAPGTKKLFDLANLVKDVAADADYEATAQDRHVHVGTNDLAVVHGDRDLLRSAIENVVRNAIRYTPKSTDVKIDLKRLEGTHASVTVRDRGPGVPEEALQHLFEPFYRVNDARDRDSGGAGLGLAITQHVVHAHGGTVRAANCSDGGFEIEIQIPLKVPEVANRKTIKFRAG